MFNRDDQLDIFESFITDFALPKHTKIEVVTGAVLWKNVEVVP
jgi:hypothetical protein